ncbi:bacteriohemerythrin [Desulfovibrio cuneatus]|uniref:bacteriohemerythrin n=1 Tax=Desulfovibrio cuneatus TaxID=159728 RepID=UPI00040E745B|nr:hemerythrin family protein [Desulfovibrio cuneatus]
MFNLYIIPTKESKIGVPIVDEQHCSMTSTINSLYFSMNRGHSQKLLLSTIEAFEVLASIHFTVEEEILELINYTYIKNHIEAHKKVRDELHTLLVKNKRTGDPNDLLTYFKVHWLPHIDTFDRHYAKFMHNHYNQPDIRS